jgi:diadenosine tetraphosphatase ApaH/serine/threonine PP2A family protein phosphatase
MRAVLSDIHGNLEALGAVLADCDRQGVQGIYCLGDFIGYGPNPCECLDLATEWELTLCGNWDQCLLADPVGFGVVAYRSVTWTLAQMEYKQRRPLYQAFVAGLPRTHQEGDFLFVHGSPRNPLNEYIFPEDVHNSKKMTRNFDLVGRYCFTGHTHVPGVFTEDWQFRSPVDLRGVYRLTASKAIINVGSVGQPRDADCRACYAILDDDSVRFRRVEYNVDATVQKIYAAHDLDPFLGDRLRVGR